MYEVRHYILFSQLNIGDTFYVPLDDNDALWCVKMSEESYQQKRLNGKLDRYGELIHNDDGEIRVFTIPKDHWLVMTKT